MNLTLEQKAKRYDYLENALYNFLEQKIADSKYNGEDLTEADVVENWLNEVDVNADIIPHELYLLFDKICDENYPDFISSRNYPLTKPEYLQFEQKIEENTNEYARFIERRKKG